MFKAILKNGQTETESFRNIEDIYEIEELSSNDVAPIKILFETGEIFVNNKCVERLYTLFHANAKPIQFRKAVDCVDLSTGSIVESYEEQYIGYEYTVDNDKVKIEIYSNIEIKCVAAMITTTDLRTNQKSERHMRLA